MSEEQSAGEAMAFGLIEQANRLAKAASITQATLTKQIEELIAMEARVNVAVQRLDGLFRGFEGERVKLEGERTKLEAERVKLKAIGPELEQSATWAMRETLREQGGQIKSEIKFEVQHALIQPLQDIQASAGHVLQNVWETKLLYIGFVLLFGILIGYGADQYRVGVHQSRMETQMTGIQGNINYIWEHLQQQEEQKKAGTHQGKGK